MKIGSKKGNILIKNNYLKSTAEDVIKVFTSKNISFIGNTLDTGETRRWKSIIPDDDYLKDSGIDIVHAKDITIKNNDFVGHVATGITMKTGTNNVDISNNHFTGKYLDAAIKIGGRGDSFRNLDPWLKLPNSEADNIRVIDNVIEGEFHWGRVFQLRGGQNSVVDGNFIFPKTETKLYLSQQSNSSDWSKYYDGTDGWFNSENIAFLNNVLSDKVEDGYAEKSLTGDRESRQNRGFVEKGNSTGTLQAVDFPAGADDQPVEPAPKPISVPTPPTTPAPTPPTTKPSLGNVIILQADDATLDKATIETEHSELTSSGYINFDNVSDSGADWTFNSTINDGQLTIRYANGSSNNRRMKLFVQGADKGIINFNSTGSWDTWKEKTVALSGLKKGDTIRLEAANPIGGPNIEQLVVEPSSNSDSPTPEPAEADDQPVEPTPPTPTPPTPAPKRDNSVILQADDATLDKATIETEHSELTGSGYINFDNVSDSGASWAFNSTINDGQLTIRYANGSSNNRTMKLFAGGVEQGIINFNGTGSWDTWKEKTVALSGLKKGDTIRLEAANPISGPNIEQLVVKPSANSDSPTPEPADDNLKSAAIGEYGRTTLDHRWQTIKLDDSYDNPVVLVSDPTLQEADPAVVRLRNIAKNSFQVRVQEPNYLTNNQHASESVSYMVMEAGDWMLADGTRISAGTHKTRRLTSQGFDSIRLKAFDKPPTVLSQVQTSKGRDWVTTRTKGRLSDSFQISMQEEEARNSGGHTDETLGWVAIDTRVATDGDTLIEGNTTGRTVNSDRSSVTFKQAFDTAPSVIAKLSSYFGADTANLRLDEISRTGFGVKVQEEQSLDLELGHTKESISFLALEGQEGALTGSAI
ncbi:MAG: right-handed parallel beta-helix repeat-containing protein [Cyanobacteria bacterium J06648_10]